MQTLWLPQRSWVRICILPSWPSCSSWWTFPGDVMLQHLGLRVIISLVVEHLVTYVASWLGSFTCLNPFNPETCLLGQAFLEAQRSCHWACKSVTRDGFWSLYFLSLRQENWDIGCNGLTKDEIFRQLQLLAWAHPVQPGALWRTAEPHSGHRNSALSCCLFTVLLWLAVQALGGSHLWQRSERAGQVPMFHLQAGFLESQL